MDRNIYLSNMEIDKAIELYFGSIDIKPQKEVIDTRNSNGRVTAVPIYSRVSSPHYNSSAMDGIATYSSRTAEASDRNHLILEEGKDYVVVDTGDPIPKDMDCVIMVEDLMNAGEGKVSIMSSASPWQNIRPIGEDIVENQLILPSNQVIRPVDIGAMLAGGVNSIEVYKKPSVCIIPTGTEIVEPGTSLKPGDIIEFNSMVFKSQVEDWGGEPVRHEIIKDNYVEIKEAVKDAADKYDIVLINAGSSAGREDFTASIIGELGRVVLHGAAIKPGKPVIMGIVNNKPVVGIPGYPVSAYFIMDILVKRLLYAMRGLEVPQQDVIKAVLSRRVMSSLKYHEFVRIKLGAVRNKIIATPLTRGAGATMSLVRADGVLEVPQNIEGIEAGTTVDIKLLKDERDIKNTIVCIGSHDPIIDVLSDMIHSRYKEYFLSSAHVGSMGGIMALKNKETHIAPIHLLDMDTGEYNLSYIKRYLAGMDISLIKCVKRVQGLMVPKGNPLNIRNFADLKEKDLRFINRQRGSGTRLLLDYNLKRLGISSESIKGYGREEFTHLSVAAAVASGDGDTGLGIYSAAAMMGLDFIPVCNEEYDLAIPTEFLELDMIKKMIDVMTGDEFKSELKRLGGYDFSEIGQIIQIGD